MGNLWKDEVGSIKEFLDEGITLREIGELYGVSKQRMYQVLTKYGIPTSQRNRTNYLRDKGVDKYWLARMLRAKKFSGAERTSLLETIATPSHCPILGLELNYDGTGVCGKWSHKDNSPSIDRIDSTKGYEATNIVIISWRANRIKNDGTWEELLRIGNYYRDLSLEGLQFG